MPVILIPRIRQRYRFAYRLPVLFLGVVVTLCATAHSDHAKTVSLPAPASSSNTPSSRIVEDIKAGYFRAALAQLKPILPAKADDAAYQYRYAQALSGNGDNHQALKAIRKAINLAPHRSAYYRLQGKIYGAMAEEANIFSAMGLAKRVLNSFRSAVRLDPHDSKALVDLATYYINAPGIVGGSDRKARELVGRLEKLNPVAALRVKARAATQHHEYAKAETLLRRAEKRDRTSKSAKALAFLYLKRQRYKDAFENFRLITKHNPKHITAWFWVGRTSILARFHYHEGIAALEHYISAPRRPDAAPSLAFAHLRLGDLFRLNGQDHLACTEYAKAKDATGNHNRKFLFDLGKSLRGLKATAPYAKKAITSIKAFSKTTCNGIKH